MAGKRGVQWRLGGDAQPLFVVAHLEVANTRRAQLPQWKGVRPSGRTR